MDKEQVTSADSSVDFNIKHRLAGAGVLIFFGVLILPWMLGPPGDRVGGQTANAARDSELVEAAELIDVESDDDFGAESDTEETVYISKITPLDGQNPTNPSTKVTTASVKADERVEKVEKETKAVADEVEKVAISSAIKSEVKPESEQRSGAENKTEVAAQEAPKSSPPQTDTKEPSAATSSSSIEVGWVVQVGLFSREGYQLRAEKMVSDLVNDGFKAGSTVVETNKGEGLRVWLGPFAKRAEASREVERLKGVTGKDGFVRVYP